MSDMVCMLLAIRSGDLEAFHTWIFDLDEMEAIGELTNTYGGTSRLDDKNRPIKDEDGLFQGTSPVLHAAQTGNVSMYSSVLDEMKKREVRFSLAMQGVSLPEGGGGTDNFRRSRFRYNMYLESVPSTHTFHHGRYECGLMYRCYGLYEHFVSVQRCAGCGILTPSKHVLCRAAVYMMNQSAFPSLLCLCCNYEIVW